MPILITISAVLTAIPVIAGIMVIRQLDKPMLWLLVYLSLALLTELSSYLFYSNEIDRAWILHIFTVIEFILLTAIYAFWQKQRNYKWAILFTIPVFVCIWLSAKLSWEVWAQFDNYTASFAALLLNLLAILMLYQLNEETPIDLMREPRFWVSLAILVYFTGNILNFALYNLAFAWRLNAVVNVAAHILYTGAFLCHHPRLKSGGLSSWAL
jgi:hypothetical protein